MRFSLNSVPVAVLVSAIFITTNVVLSQTQNAIDLIILNGAFEMSFCSLLYVCLYVMRHPSLVSQPKWKKSSWRTFVFLKMAALLEIISKPMTPKSENENQIPKLTALPVNIYFFHCRSFWNSHTPHYSFGKI